MKWKTGQDISKGKPREEKWMKNTGKECVR